MDLGGYYIVWPDKSYYKQRMFRGDIRYKGPKGHKVPLYVIKGNKNLIIVEGEINAITLGILGLKDTIVSPGSAGEINKHVSFYLQYSRIRCIVDKDIPGVVAGLKLKEELLKYKRNIQLVAVSRDFNDVLETEGQEGLKKYYQDQVGL